MSVIYEFTTYSTTVPFFILSRIQWLPWLPSLSQYVSRSPSVRHDGPVSSSCRFNINNICMCRVEYSTRFLITYIYTNFKTSIILQKSRFNKKKKKNKEREKHVYCFKLDGFLTKPSSLFCILLMILYSVYTNISFINLYSIILHSVYIQTFQYIIFIFILTPKVETWTDSTKFFMLPRWSFSGGMCWDMRWTRASSWSSDQLGGISLSRTTLSSSGCVILCRPGTSCTEKCCSITSSQLFKKWVKDDNYIGSYFTMQV